MLSWASLTVNNYTFIINNQQMIDWAINGAMEVQDAGVCNKMHDASAEFHYHLFRCKHKSYYGAQDFQVLGERKTVANACWLHRLVGVSLSRHRGPRIIDKESLAEINISKAYNVTFRRI